MSNTIHKDTDDPEQGQEDSFMSHLIELRKRLMIAVGSVMAVFVVLFIYPSPSYMYDLLAQPMLASLPQGTRMIATGVITPFMVPVKVTLSEIEDDIQQLHFAVTMSGIAEQGGVCTATATKGSKKVTVTQQADYNVNRTECGGLRFDLADLSSGSWKVVVSYSSKKYTGTSPTTTVKVP